MKILTNEKSIRRNARIGQYTSLASLVILAGGMYVSFVYPTQVNISFIALLVGFLLSQVGIFFGNRWGRRPRVDERLTAALKGLTKDYTFYHFLTPVHHLLIGPAGIWIVETFYQRGKISYEKGKWRQKGGGLLLGYLKIFAQEGLGNPEMEAKADIDNLTAQIKKSLVEDKPFPPVNLVMVFTDDRVELDAEGSPFPAMKIDDLKEFFRKTSKLTPVQPEEIAPILNIFPTESNE